MFLSKIFSKKKEVELSKDEIAALLKTSQKLLEEFEKAYNARPMEEPKGFFDLSATDVVRMGPKATEFSIEVEDTINRIVDNLVNNTFVYSYDNGITVLKKIPAKQHEKISLKEVNSLPKEIRPQLTDKHMRVDVDANSSSVLLMNYKNYLEETDEEKKKHWYHLFRQGLDIVDLDAVTYEILGMNKNNIGYWLPKIVNAVKQSDVFMIPNTDIIKVPLPILQLTRTDIFSLTPTTKEIVNRYCQRVFKLDTDKHYFIKTGTYSSKFEFRNACIKDPKEVLEIGEYLLFIQHQAVQMASPLSSPCIYGVSTTNEWCVREYIEDKENNPTIYNGLPLHTEYRVFIDCDTDKVIGIHNYWDSEVMKDRFSNHSDADTPEKKHDYVIYTAHEETLYKRYEENKDRVVAEIEKILPEMNLSGQWSIDIMQNGNDFWIIDMAIAETSAFYDCIPEELRKPIKENWLPDFSQP